MHGKLRQHESGERGRDHLRVRRGNRPGHDRAGRLAGGAVSSCPVTNTDQTPCDSPHQLRVAYGIQPLLDSGINGRGETVTILAPAASPNTSAGPAGTDIRQDLKALNNMFGLPAARIQIVTTLAGAAAPWQAGDEEIGDTEIVHTVAPAATLRVVLLPPGPNLFKGAAPATADMLAGLRLAVSGTDVALISWGLGEHFFTPAQVTQLHSILLAAAAHHVTVVASSGDNGGLSDAYVGTPVKEVSLPASGPLVLGVGGTSLTAKPSGAYIRETAFTTGGGFSHLYARPAYQDGVPRIPMTRGVPDVAADADQPGPPTVFARRQHRDKPRHQQLHAAVGRAHRAGRPGRSSRSRLR